MAAKRRSGNWIKDAIKRPGALRAKAKRAGAITKQGTIDPDWLEEQASKGNTTTARQARLAMTLRRMNRRRRR